MKKWLIALVAFGSMVACGEQDSSEEGAADVQAQVAAVDASAKPSTPSTGEIGSACVADTDCKGAGATCRKSQALPFGDPIPFPGGLCTKSCKVDKDCDAAAGCPLAMAELFLPGISICLQPCKVAADCREGYRCASTSIGAIPGLGGAAPAGAPANYCLPPSPGLPAGGGLPTGVGGLPGAAPTAK